MTNITKFINEINKTNGSNDKIATLTSYKSDTLVQRVLKMTYDKVCFTYGVTMKNIPTISNYAGTATLSEALDVLENDFATRKITGNAALLKLEQVLFSLSEEDAIVLIKIIGRDLKIAMGRTSINKVIKNLIVKPPYMRCEIGNEKNVKKNIDFKKRVFSQVKMDGTYRAATIDSDDITVMSRAGNEDSFPIIEKEILSLEIDGGTLLGEMTLRGEQDRSVGNGIINSITERELRQSDIVFTVWDLVPANEYSMDKDQIKAATKAGTLSKYGARLDKLEAMLKEANLKNVELVEYKEVQSMKEAYEHFQVITERGDEGTVIKTEELVWKDGNSKQQLKVKLVVEIDVRIVSFNKGNIGSKNEAYFSGINYSNDDGTIQGSVGVTSLTEELRDWFFDNMDKVTGDVMTLVCNDITQARGSETFALSHPRYEELRGKEKVTDTLERALEQKTMAMEMKARLR